MANPSKAKTAQGMARAASSDEAKLRGEGHMQWFDIPTEHRAGRECASAGCGEQATARLEAGGVGSNYCSGCRAQIEGQSRLPAHLRIAPSEK